MAERGTASSSGVDPSVQHPHEQANTVPKYAVYTPSAPREYGGMVEVPGSAGDLRCLVPKQNFIKSS